MANHPSNRTIQARANCTHITMDIVYSSSVCDLCQRPSSLGWLYKCHQDHLQSLNPPEEVGGPNIGHAADNTAQEFRKFGFSRAVIVQVLSGQYTEHQIEILKQQKTRVNELVRDQLIGNPGTARENEQIGAVLHPNITIRPRKFRSNNEAEQKKPLKVIQANPPCALKCCHRCRPYYRDRVYASLNEVVENIDAVNSKTPASGVKVLNARVVKHIGLMSNSEDGTDCTSSLSSTSTSDCESTDIENIDTATIRDDELAMVSFVQVPSHWKSGLIQENGSSPRAFVISHEDSTLSQSANTRIPPTSNGTGPVAQQKMSEQILVDEESQQGQGLVARLLHMTRSASHKIISGNKGLKVAPLVKRSYSLSHKNDSSADNGRKYLGMSLIPGKRESSIQTGPNPDVELVKVRDVADDGAETRVALSEIAVEEHVPDIITQP